MTKTFVCVWVKKFLNIFFFRFCMLRVFINFLSFRFGISLLVKEKKILVSFTLCSHSSRCLEELNLNRCIVRCWKTIKIFYNKRSLQNSLLVAQFSHLFDSFSYSVHTPERIMKVYLRQEFFSKTSFFL